MFSHREDADYCRTETGYPTPSSTWLMQHMLTPEGSCFTRCPIRRGS